ncbi:MAG: sterol desaturase family protein [Phreatobacter sp.]|uniref:sterol desaturase family protein n=1 Tax=Phreatobacter sp. TaxID=1966341 RepID=UPI001A385AAB|nr:sterol desaturase family protein [Phreatobacter sp.]MBL8571825.1 sterol desaturase family protein [Phreatobacter sp.]
MNDLLANQTVLRLGAFAGVFAAMAAWEVLAPRRPRPLPRRGRWPGNLGIVVLDTLALRVIFPVTAVAWAAAIEAKGIGLLPLAGLSGPWLVAVAAVLLDLAIWAQHVVFHHVPVLWRLHRMHHADLDLDVTSGARFHPIEILLSMAIKFAVIALLGAPPLAVLLFEVLLNACAMFNHANVRLPAPLDALLRAVLVTPDMHRVHHSVRRDETDSNFGFCLAWWDRMFGTYRAAPAAGQLGMTIGLTAFRDPGEQRLDRMLTQPFRDDQTDAAP